MCVCVSVCACACVLVCIVCRLCVCVCVCVCVFIQVRQQAALALGYSAEIWDAGCHPQTLPDADFEAMRRAGAASALNITSQADVSLEPKADVATVPTSKADVSLEPTADVEMAMLFCAQCGTKQTPTGKWCANCGAAIAASV